MIKSGELDPYTDILYFWEKGSWVLSHTSGIKIGKSLSLSWGLVFPGIFSKTRNNMSHTRLRVVVLVVDPRTVFMS